MTPQDALAKAIHVYLDHHDDDCGCDDEAATLVPLLADGWTVARTQDARDGEALRLLREAMNPSDGLLLALTSRGVVQASVAVIPAEHRGIGDPVSKAADACRAQLESAAIEATR